MEINKKDTQCQPQHPQALCDMYSHPLENKYTHKHYTRAQKGMRLRETSSKKPNWTDLRTGRISRRNALTLAWGRCQTMEGRSTHRRHVCVEEEIKNQISLTSLSRSENLWGNQENSQSQCREFGGWRPGLQFKNSSCQEWQLHTRVKNNGDAM